MWDASQPSSATSSASSTWPQLDVWRSAPCFTLAMRSRTHSGATT